MNNQQPRPVPGAHLRPGSQMAAPSDVASEPQIPVAESVQSLLDEVDHIREQAGETFDLAALARQTELLEKAHDVLTAALAEVDPR
ncbi:hypothetical protein [Gordonia sputi]|uniref:Uncharacterized protein n=1 Tax=Gordonia sputi NBRC 100414 TaxID=1089453 RepID=H5U2P4_9ACTN|nr:hypothetical protein [Gordonia sputi]NKY95076.1 hypothetical protein [Gordonia sputi]GAB40002.1 hypothetical protein GOSPT_085_01200 [Gordonia sputi NBRC 100414]